MGGILFHIGCDLRTVLEREERTAVLVLRIHQRLHLLKRSLAQIGSPHNVFERLDERKRECVKGGEWEREG